MLLEQLDVCVIEDLNPLDLVQSEPLNARFEGLSENTCPYSLRVELGPGAERFKLSLMLDRLDYLEVCHSSFPMESTVEAHRGEYFLLYTVSSVSDDHLGHFFACPSMVIVPL